MQKRRRFKQTESLQDQLMKFASEARENASRLPPGPEKDDMLKKASQAETASRLDEWANSAGLQVNPD
jgi:hypothetical protein